MSLHVFFGWFVCTFGMRAKRKTKKFPSQVNLIAHGTDESLNYSSDFNELSIGHEYLYRVRISNLKQKFVRTYLDWRREYRSDEVQC